jgi:hypothetical protein
MSVFVVQLFLHTIHGKKRLVVFPSPAVMSLTKLSLAGNYQIIPGQGEFGDIRLGTKKTANIFYSVCKNPLDMI